jgi:hypothetical protein
VPSVLLPRRPVCALGALALAVCGLVAVPAARSGDDTLDSTLDRASARVEEFFARAQSLVCTETVHVQPLSYGLTSDGFGRTIESELRLTWTPGADGEAATEAQALRQVMRVNGHPPRKNDRRNCTTAERNDTETQVLSMLLDGKRDEFGWELAGSARIDKRAALLLDYREKARITLDVRVTDGDEDCLTFDIRGGDRGRVWLDAETYDVLRVDQRLTGQVEAPTPRLLLRRPGASPHTVVERLDRSYRFKRLTFTDPDETMVLPVTATQIMVTHGNTVARQRVTTEYRNYRRFLTGGRVVPEPGQP